MSPLTCVVRLFVFGVLATLSLAAPVRAEGEPLIVIESTAAEMLSALPDADQRSITEDLVRNGLGAADLERIWFTPSTDDADGITIRDEAGRASASHLIFLGARIGVPYLLGVSGTYLHESAGKIRFHLEAELATSILIGTGNVAAGYHPGGGSFYFGGRLHQYAIIEFFEGDTSAQRGTGVEIGWTRRIGRSQRGLLTTRIGGTALFNGKSELMRVIPDVAVGLSLRVFKR
jgi:hypothetical protein